ncbi:MAG: hypothetical protein AAF841_05840 [Pseudomonadota bacterium]
MTRALIALLALALLGGCASALAAATEPEAPRFFWGLWHGLIAPISLIASIWVEEIAMYAVPNAGPLYDLGFLLGVLAWGGAGGSLR